MAIKYLVVQTKKGSEHVSLTDKPPRGCITLRQNTLKILGWDSKMHPNRVTIMLPDDLDSTDWTTYYNSFRQRASRILANQSN